MLNRRVLLEGAGAFLAQAISLNAQHDGASKVVFKHELPEVMLKDWSVTAVEVSYAPGECSYIYARANVEAKRKALEKVDGAARSSKPPRWKREVELMAWLDSL